MYGIRMTFSKVYVVYDTRTGKGVYWTATYKEAEKYVRDRTRSYIVNLKQTSL